MRASGRHQRRHRRSGYSGPCGGTVAASSLVCGFIAQTLSSSLIPTRTPAVSSPFLLAVSTSSTPRVKFSLARCSGSLFRGSRDLSAGTQRLSRSGSWWSKIGGRISTPRAGQTRGEDGRAGGDGRVLVAASPLSLTFLFLLFLLLVDLPSLGFYHGRAERRVARANSGPPLAVWQCMRANVVIRLQ